MKLSYEIFIRHEIYQILQKVSAGDRERFCYFVESLAADPFRVGDATTPDLLLNVNGLETSKPLRLFRCDRLPR